MKIYTGKEIVEKYVNIQNDVFADEREFLLVEIHKEELYDCVCWDGLSKNLKTYEEWETDDDNYDQYHTNTIDEMVSFIKNGGELPLPSPTPLPKKQYKKQSSNPKQQFIYLNKEMKITESSSKGKRKGSPKSPHMRRGHYNARAKSPLLQVWDG